MLGEWRNHKDYQSFVVSNLSSVSDKNALLEYEDIISKLYILNLDELKRIVSHLYPPIGRPSEVQPEIFRAFVLANDLGIVLDNLPEKLRHNFILRTAAGFTEDSLVGIASYYDFINRVIRLDERPREKAKKRKPSKKIGKGQKLPPKNPGIVAKLVNRILNKGENFDRRPEKKLQQIFAGVCVKKSIELGIVPENLDVSGDGTCMKTGASHYGARTCKCHENGNYKCDCPRKFSDPNATWGWDSHNNQWFYGYSGYFISTYNKDLKTDLPLYLRLVEASRHDSVSAVVALAEFRKLYPNLSINTFISDSASDNYATYELLNQWNINAVIALNPTNTGNSQYPTHLNIDENGIPVCTGGSKMVNWGFNRIRCRIKWRCPKACGKNPANCGNCSPSNYGRTIYTKPEWDLRLFTIIPRGSILWKEKMNARTSSERVNNRILHDYNIEAAATRGKKRISFFTTIAACNIHLDAQLRVLKERGQLVFSDLFLIPLAA
jgi:hypothetical protein